MYLLAQSGILGLYLDDEHAILAAWDQVDVPSEDQIVEANDLLDLLIVHTEGSA